ncbi:MAG: hypothetical protein WBF07_17600, partial [Xanthobacteraceae bacterium]
SLYCPRETKKLLEVPRSPIRHPEVAAKRLSKGAAEAPGPSPSRLAPLAPQDDGKEVIAV